MKKVIVNADIMAMYKTLNSMKSRADLIAGDVGKLFSYVGRRLTGVVGGMEYALCGS